MGSNALPSIPAKTRYSVAVRTRRAILSTDDDGMPILFLSILTGETAGRAHAGAADWARYKHEYI